MGFDMFSMIVFSNLNAWIFGILRTGRFLSSSMWTLLNLTVMARLNLTRNLNACVKAMRHVDPFLPAMEITGRFGYDRTL